MAVMDCPGCGVRVNAKAPRCPSCGAEIWSEKEAAARPSRKLGLLGWLTVLLCVSGILVAPFWGGFSLSPVVLWVALPLIIILVITAARTWTQARRERISWAAVLCCAAAYAIAFRLPHGMAWELQRNGYDPKMYTDLMQFDEAAANIGIAIGALTFTIAIVAAAADRFGRTVVPKGPKARKPRKPPEPRFIDPKALDT